MHENDKQWDISPDNEPPQEVWDIPSNGGADDKDPRRMQDDWGV